MTDTLKTEFGLLRHARTVWNEEKRIQGHNDSPLTRKGEDHARQWGIALQEQSWDGILTSDTGRALKTARIVNESLHVSIEKDPRLREQDWGEWTGMTIAEIESLFSSEYGRQDGVGWHFCPPGGESRSKTWQRGHQALVKAAEAGPGRSILVVTHEGMIRCLVNRCMRFKFIVGEPKVLLPDRLHLFTCQNGRLSINKLNAVSIVEYRPLHE